MATNNVTLSEELEDVIRLYEEEGQTVVFASIAGKNIITQQVRRAVDG